MSDDLRSRRNRKKPENVNPPAKPRKSKRWFWLILLLLIGAGGFYAHKTGSLDVVISSLFNSSKVEKNDDIDNDGIPNSEDSCPNEPGLIRCNGCPDTDKDGICNQEDKCPDDFSRTNSGCPKAEPLPKDTDGDGVLDAVDKCINIIGVAYCNGCADTDGDGVCDDIDDCDNEKGTPSNNGCPENIGNPQPANSIPVNPAPTPVRVNTDTDGDGIQNGVDECINIPGVPRCNGCPDTDGDGVCDKNDKCPTVYGTGADGCSGPSPDQCMAGKINLAEQDIKKASGYSSPTSKRVETALKAAKTNYEQALTCSYITFEGRKKAETGISNVKRKLYLYHEAKGDNDCKLGKTDYAKEQYRAAQSYINNPAIQKKLKQSCPH